jgi:hypothetical protein
MHQKLKDFALLKFQQKDYVKAVELFRKLIDEWNGRRLPNDELHVIKMKLATVLLKGQRGANSWAKLRRSLSHSQPPKVRSILRFSMECIFSPDTTKSVNLLRIKTLRASTTSKQRMGRGRFWVPKMNHILRP